MRSITAILTFCLNTIVYGQVDIKENLSSNRNDYFNKSLIVLGETHVYGLFQIYQQSDELQSAYVNNKNIQMGLLSYFVDSLAFNTIALEFPVSFEFFFNKYCETNDERYLFYFAEDTVQLDYYRKIKELKRNHPEIEIVCIDNEYKKAYYITQVALLLTIYDAIGVDYTFSADKWTISELYDIYIEKINNKNPMHYPLSLLFNYKTFSNRKMYSNFLEMEIHLQKNEELYKNILKENYDYYVRTLHSFIYSFESGKQNKINKLQRREMFLANELKAVFASDPTCKIICTVGSAHVINEYEHLYGKRYKNFRIFFELLIEQEQLKNQTCSFVFIYPNLETSSIFYESDNELLKEYVQNNRNNVIITRDQIDPKIFERYNINGIINVQ